ncbi:MAG: M20/M25/M40 family metallo-hydrolase [Spirochaetes bacterium]|nr:M20/M25/M40 family metallo-hydrolase [Spirochaetota bacterium]
MSIIPEILASFAVALFLVFSVAVMRTLAVPRAHPPGKPDPALARRFSGTEEALAALVRCPTVSRFGDDGYDAAASDSFREELARRFPLVHERLLRRDVGERAMLFEWPGSTSADPVLLMSHYDVVPTGEAPWTHEPFSGDLAGEYVWGRGSQDTKVTLVGALAAAESLLAGGFAPGRTVFFGFGGDEEVGGVRGAASIAEYLEKRNVRLAFLLDEGGVIADGILSFADRPLALVGISEKGYVDFTIEVPGSGGYASMPPKRTAAGDLARAMIAVERKRPRARLTYTVRSMLAALAPYAPFPLRLALRNLWLSAPLVKAVFGASGLTNALIRTTAAVTMLSASDKENVLPDRVRANVNVRVLPGDTVSLVMTRLARIAAPFGARVKLTRDGHANDPLPESPVMGEGWDAIASALAVTHPEAAIIPFLFSAGTDTKHYRGIADAMYRISPIVQTSDDISRVHGTDERISMENVRRCAAFYRELESRL